MARAAPLPVVQSPRSYAARGNYVDQPPDKLVLVIDLDETLVYALRKDRQPPPQLRPEDETPGLPQLDRAVVSLGDEQFDVLIRPGAVEFLHRMSKLYTCYLYTMGTPEYVQQILPVLDPSGEIFRPGQVCAWTPDHDRTTKDLSRVGVDEKQVLILDDALYAWRDYVSNLVLISRFVGDRRDSALHVLPQYLRQLHTSFFHPRTLAKQRDARVLLADLCKPLMARCELSFTGYKHPTPELMKEEPICQLAARFGASLAFAVRPTTTHLVIRDSGSAARAVDWSQSAKVRLALRESANRVASDEDALLVVSEQWLLASICSLWPLDERPFILVNQDGSNVEPPTPVDGVPPTGVADQAMEDRGAAGDLIIDSGS